MTQIINKQTPDLVGLRKINIHLSDVPDLTKTDRFPQDPDTLVQVGAVRNHAERLAMLIKELDRMVLAKQKFCEHLSIERVDWNKFSTTNICKHCRQVIVKETVQDTTVVAQEPIRAAV